MSYPKSLNTVRLWMQHCGRVPTIHESFLALIHLTECWSAAQRFGDSEKALNALEEMTNVAEAIKKLNT